MRRCRRADSRLANEPLAVFSTHDVKQRSLLRSRGAFLRPGLSFLFASAWRRLRWGRPAATLATAATPTSAIPFPQRGVSGAPTGALFNLSRVRGATSEPCGAACPVANGTSLGAPPWRFFGRGPAPTSPAVPPEPVSDPPAPGHKAPAGGSRTSRGAVRAAVAGRHSPLPSSGSSPETPLMSEDANLLLHIRYVVNNIVVR
jgi:hypothetical protein